ncbi:hypothetical protein TrVE_jg11430 [Triparma verrucosa]|uniref:Uncharacterized protein n=1 Tax=Triparma verrucosa TaxID=1606542 RepID=A0A9W7FB97_9STRA|nr:hypothetical protein TrVE_jg11430 [Triparma verrucosa]
MSSPHSVPPAPEAPPPSPTTPHTAALNKLHGEISDAILNYETDFSYVNFSEELFGDKNVISDQDMRRVPSVLSLFSEKSEESSARVNPSPTNYPQLFTSPKHILNSSAYNLLPLVESLESEKSIKKVPSLADLKGQHFQDSLNRLGVKIVDDDDFEYPDSDEEEAAPQQQARQQAQQQAQQQSAETPNTIDNDNNNPNDGTQPTTLQTASSTTSKLLMTPSFVQSMSEYAFRREQFMEKIEEGSLVASMTPSKEGAVDKRQQINLDFYSDENQARRRHIKKHPQFIAIVMKLWNCVDLIKDEEGFLTKAPYLQMSFKITCLIVPPPIDAAFAKRHAEEDWEADTKGKGKLLFDEFFVSIFQLVDTWTESCNAEDYIEMVLRLVDGICFHDNGGLQFKADEKIVFDRFFSFIGDVKTIEPYGVPLNKTEEDKEEGKQNPSKLIEHSTSPGPSSSTKKKGKKGKKNSKTKKPTILPLDKVTSLIGRLYSEKAKADFWIDKKEETTTATTTPAVASNRKRPSLINPKSLKKLRFDAFIMRHFKSQHGTRGIARRHLRNFVVSVQHLCAESARVEVFRKLAGIPKLDGSSEPYIPSLIVRYFLPLMQNIFSSSEGIAKGMAGKEVCQAPVTKVVEVVERSLTGVYFGSRMVGNFKINCEKIKVSDSKTKKQMLDFDEACEMAYPLFVYSDSMRAFSQVRGARTIQRWFRSGPWPPYTREVVQPQEPIAEQGSLNSPRTKLEEARKLDNEINSSESQPQ